MNRGFPLPKWGPGFTLPWGLKQAFNISQVQPNDSRHIPQPPGSFQVKLKMRKVSPLYLPYAIDIITSFMVPDHGYTLLPNLGVNHDTETNTRATHAMLRSNEQPINAELASC